MRAIRLLSDTPSYIKTNIQLQQNVYKAMNKNYSAKLNQEMHGIVYTDYNFKNNVFLYYRLCSLVSLLKAMSVAIEMHFLRGHYGSIALNQPKVSTFRVYTEHASLNSLCPHQSTDMGTPHRPDIPVPVNQNTTLF